MTKANMHEVRRHLWWIHRHRLWLFHRVAEEPTSSNLQQVVEQVEKAEKHLELARDLLDQ